MNEHDDSILASVDLHAWRVPPPAAIDRAALLGRALSPSTIPPRSSRLGWLLAAIVIINAALATLIVLLARPSAPVPTIALPAGGGDSEARLHELLQQLDQQRLELERKLDELDQALALLQKLSKEQTDERSDPARSEPSRKTAAPEALGRAEISKAIAAIKPRLVACARETVAKGIVKASVRVAPDGSVSRARITQTPDERLGDCVARAIEQAPFPRTRKGGSFSYPFVF